jgi:putative ATP-dependent endonuclease of OLD family
MGRLKTIRIRNYRSIGGWVQVDMPQRGPLVLLGENNAGKSNLIGALDIVLGETWPGSFHPEEHDFHDRDREQLPMQVVLSVSDVVHAGRYDTMEVSEIAWRYDPSEEDRPCALDVSSATGATQWANGGDRAQLACVIVGADRRLSYQLSYTSKWTLLARLMRKFHERLVADDDRVARLQRSFDDVVEIFREVEEFSHFSGELRTMAGEFAANLRYGLDLDFSAYDPSNYFRSLRVQSTSDGEVRSFDELGTGQEQILAVAFAYAYARSYGAGDDGLVMVIEEPEAHLHPIAQRWLGRKISELHGAGVQMVVTTHSPSFVDLGNPGAIACVRKPGTGGATQVIQHSRHALAEQMRSTGATLATPQSIGPFYAASATSEHVAGMFARACLVVEGPTEVLALPNLLEGVGVDVPELGVDIVSAGGIGGIARWLRLYWAYGIPAFAIFDRDTREDASGARRADLLVTLSEAPDDYTAALADGAPVTVQDGYAVFTNDFETALRSLFPEYRGYEAEAATLLGSSKQLVAREACRRLRDLPGAPGWRPIELLGRAVQGLSHAA